MSHLNSTAQAQNLATMALALYSSYALASWSRRGMEFTIALILIVLYPDSLLLVSLYGILDNAARVTLGAAIGRHIDVAERWPGACNCYLLQNGCIAGAGLCMAAVLAGLAGEASGDPGAKAANYQYWTLVVLSLLLCAGSSVGSTGIMIAVEKNMPKQLCRGDSFALSKMNSAFRAIDLVCLLASPILSGCLMTFYSPLSSVLLLSGYCVLAWAPELLLLRWAFRTSSLLSKQAGNSWATYFHQHVLLANLSLATLYMTVLSLGFLMTSYLKYCGLTEAEVSLYRGVGSLTGLLSTVVFPFLRHRVGLVWCGLLGIVSQVFCLSLGVLPGLYYSLGLGQAAVPTLAFVRLLIGSVVASRFGLWLFDLAVNQLVQESVRPNDLGAVCGVQSSICSCFETLSFLAGTFLRDPSEFWALMLASLMAVWAAQLLYVIFMATGSNALTVFDIQAKPEGGDLTEALLAGLEDQK